MLPPRCGRRGRRTARSRRGTRICAAGISMLLTAPPERGAEMEKNVRRVKDHVDEQQQPGADACRKVCEHQRNVENDASGDRRKEQPKMRAAEHARRDPRLLLN